jgi:hypothetical protein
MLVEDPQLAPRLPREMRLAAVVAFLDRHRRAGRNAAWLVFVCAAVFAGSAVAAAPSRPGVCDGPFEPGHPVVSGIKRSIQPDDATPHAITLAFGDSRTQRSQQLGFDIAYEPGDTLKGATVRAWVAEGEIATTDGRYAIPAAAGPWFSQRMTSRTHAEVCMQLDPRVLRGLHPGEYQGEIRVSVANGQPYSFPLTMSFRTSRWDAVAFAAVGVVLGLIVKIFSELATRNRAERTPARAAIRAYVADWSFPVILILGAISGWLGYVEMYDASSTWGATGFDAVKLFGTCFGFQLGSIGGLDLARRLASESASAQPTVATA